MSNYQTIINALSVAESLRATTKRLSKIRLEVSDSELARLLDLAIDHLTPACSSREYTATPIRLLKSTRPAITDLVEYCQTNITTGTPEWQTTALAHGWRPPEETS